jgi:LPXTG-motif cell wall-anchored protein
MAVDSAGSTEELLSTFTKFIDLLCSSEFVTLKNQTRSISGESNNQAFIFLFNHLLDKSSPELKEFLERIHQKYPTVSSFAKLWRLMKNDNPELFKKLMPEIVRLLAEISIENYIGLPEDQKFKLYEKLTNNGGESKSSWWYFLIIFGYGLIGAAGYVYLKRRNED